MAEIFDSEDDEVTEVCPLTCNHHPSQDILSLSVRQIRARESCVHAAFIPTGAIVACKEALRCQLGLADEPSLVLIAKK